MVVLCELFGMVLAFQKGLEAVFIFFLFSCLLLHGCVCVCVCVCVCSWPVCFIVILGATMVS